MIKGNKFKRIILGIIYFANLVCLLLLVMSNLANFLNPSRWWMIALSGLAFPLFFLLAIAFIIFWLFVDRKKTIISLLIVLLSIPGVKRCFAFHSSAEFTETKQAGNLRIVTWNVSLMNFEAPDSETASDNNASIFNSLQESNADVICLQKFFTEVRSNDPYNFIDSISRHLHYPYHYFSYDRPQFNGAFYNGSAIFSRYKIIDTSKIAYQGPFPGSVIEAGLLINNDTVNIITTRLQSFHLLGDDYEEIHNSKNASADRITGTKTMIEKLKTRYAQKIDQVNIVQQLIKNSKHPVIVTCDMNDVPSSYAYSNIKNNMSDVWLDKGFGIGRTYRFLAPTMRIDYIFYSGFFTATQVRRILTEASGHNGLVADFSINKTN